MIEGSPTASEDGLEFRDCGGVLMLCIAVIVFGVFSRRSEDDYSLLSPRVGRAGSFMGAEMVFLAIMSSASTFARLPKLTCFLLSHPGLRDRLSAMVFFPSGSSPPPLPIPSLGIDNSADRSVGLCRRVAASYDFFLRNTTLNWYYRAIDDTWISPGNLFLLVDQLAGFVHAETDIVIKACKTRHELYGCGPWVDGGVGWLLSRAGVRHVQAYDFVAVCNATYVRQDDTAMGFR
jgi:hypothetical protein